VSRWFDVLKYDWSKRPSQQVSFTDKRREFGDKYIEFMKKLYTKLATHPLTPAEIKRAATLGAIELPRLYEQMQQIRSDSTGKKLKRLIEQAMAE